MADLCSQQVTAFSQLIFPEHCLWSESSLWAFMKTVMNFCIPETVRNFMTTLVIKR